MRDQVEAVTLARGCPGAQVNSTLILNALQTRGIVPRLSGEIRQEGKLTFPGLEQRFLPHAAVSTQSGSEI